MSSVSSGFRVLGARALSALGRERAALSRLDAVLAASPAHRGALFHKAKIAVQTGDTETAERALRELVELEPNFPRALGSLAKLKFPGPPYREVLATIHDVLRPKTYLEIGVEFGLTLRLAERSDAAVGVDPEPRLRHVPKSNTRVFSEPSDRFFAEHTREEIFGAHRVDFAFIDGMHRFEYVLRDFVNVERWCSPGSTVVLHDCLPVDAVSARRERETQFWVGDTWKALECLLAERKDLEIRVIPTYPSGLVLIRNLDPESTRLDGKLEALERQYLDTPYPYPPGAWPAHYTILENSPEALARVLTARTTPAAHATA